MDDTPIPAYAVTTGTDWQATGALSPLDPDLTDASLPFDYLARSPSGEANRSR